MDEIKIALDGGGEISSWLVRVGDPVAEGQLIAKYVDLSNRYSELAAPASGYIKSVSNSGSHVAVMVSCTHDIQYAGLCAMCGKDISKLETVAIAHAHPKIAVSTKMAQKIEDEIATRLLSSRKLSLVLDLDNTLIHATTDKILRNAPTMNHNDIFEFTLPPDPSKYFVKLRPHLIDFLVELEKLYEIHIYTMGTRQYASKIAEIVNSHVPIFTPGRIVGRDDSVDHRSKDLQQIFPCDDRAVLIVDDREDVWKNRANLIKIEAYHYFQATRELNELPGDRKKIDEVAKVAVLKELKDGKEKVSKEGTYSPTSEPKTNPEEVIDQMIEAEKTGPEEEEATDPDTQELEDAVETNEVEQVQKTEEEPGKAEVQDGEIHQHHNDPSESIVTETDSYLTIVKEVLTQVHSTFYSSPQETRDAKEILRRIRLGILNGCTLLFSGIFPTNVAPESNECWKMAIALGAKCTKQFTKAVTHVIGATPTEKVNKATNTPGVYLVNLNWLFQSDKSWERANEILFPVVPLGLNPYPVLMKGHPRPIITPYPIEEIAKSSMEELFPQSKRKREEGNLPKDGGLEHKKGKHPSLIDDQKNGKKEKEKVIEEDEDDDDDDSDDEFTSMLENEFE